MLLCPECGNRLRKFKEEGDKFYGICINGHEALINQEDAHLKFRIRNKKPLNAKELVSIRDKEKEEKAAINISCPHCGGGKGKVLYAYTAFGDESTIRIIRCLNCGKNFRF
jgi:DNA-directed RNA polymerase subunit M/transcription elongation factor TFIIS